MLKKITEPQALYHKEGTDQTKVASNPSSSSGQQPPQYKPVRKNKALNMKVIGGVIAFAVILVVGIAGILIAQRQRQVEGPVAPTAPQSEPSAQTIVPTAPAQCNLAFTITADPEGVAQCATKIATSETGARLTNNASVRRGDMITYSLDITAESETAGEVTVIDELPVGMSFVTGSASTTQAPVYDATENTLTFNLGVISESQTISYDALIAEDSTATQLQNTATISTATAPANTADTCELTLNVSPEGVAACVDKVALTSLNGSEIGENDTILPGDTIAYRITIEADETTDGEVVVTDVLPSQLENPQPVTEGLEYSATNRTLSINLGQLASSSAQTRTIEYTATVGTNASGTIENNAQVVTGTAQAVQCPTSAVAIEGVSCNSSCTSDAQCEAINEDYTCAPTSQGQRCRLESYVASTSCEAPDATPTPTPSPTPTPTPVIGCNQLCNTNADCVNPDHICYQTADGSKRCRLDENVASDSCRLPSTPTTVAQQPELPEELPESGPEDWMNWLKAGLITLGVGAVLLLLL